MFPSEDKQHSLARALPLPLLVWGWQSDVVSMHNVLWLELGKELPRCKQQLTEAARISGGRTTARGHREPWPTSQQGLIPRTGAQLVGQQPLHQLWCSKDLRV